MEQRALKSILESLLFVSSKPLSVKELSKLLEEEELAISEALDGLAGDRKDSGIVVMHSNGEYQLATSSENSSAVKKFLNAELREKLTDATVEVLAIIAYRQPISKAEVEAIRGVNSQYSIRHLLMRGLIEKIPNPNDARSVLYRTTTEFLMHMGLESPSELPDFEKLVENIKLPETPETRAEAAAEEQQEAKAGQGAEGGQVSDIAAQNEKAVPEEIYEEINVVQSIDIPESGLAAEIQSIASESQPGGQAGQEEAEDEFYEEDDDDDDDGEFGEAAGEGESLNNKLAS